MWDTILKHLNRGISSVTMIFLAIMVIVIFVQIVSRTFLQFSYAWTEELARFLMIWVIFLGSVIAVYYGGHISIDLLIEKFRSKIQKVFYLIVSLLSILFLIILVVKGIE